MDLAIPVIAFENNVISYSTLSHDSAQPIRLSEHPAAPASLRIPHGKWWSFPGYLSHLFLYVSWQYYTINRTKCTESARNPQIFSSPWTGLCAFGCSTFRPSMSRRYCWGVSSLASASLRGHWKLPPSRSLYSSRNPSPSQYSPLLRSRRRPHDREQKQRVGKWIQPELLLNYAGQTIDSPSEIGVAAGDVDLVRCAKIIQHDCKTRSGMAVVSASAPE